MSTKELENKVDKHDTAIQLINQKIEISFTSMKEGIDNLNESMKSLKTSIDNGFVTKEQHERLHDELKVLQKQLGELESLKAWALRIILGSVILAVLALIGLRPQ